MKVVCLPLDGRPYNYDFIGSLASMDSGIELVMPDRQSLGFKKKPACRDDLDAFLLREAPSADALVISLDMHLYGGLLPARSHQYDGDMLVSRLNMIAELKKSNPALKVYASSLVLRTPKYNSNDEEPDYYAQYGVNIYRYGYLRNKQERCGLSKQENEELGSHETAIPEEVMNDWLARRTNNLTLILEALALTEQGVFETLIIPLDDTAEFGFTAQDQSVIFDTIDELGIEDNVFVHPGTDESGCTLLTRAYLDAQASPLAISTLYSNEFFRQLIPNYEDRPFLHSLCSHVRAAGMRLDTSGAKELPVLAVNGCGEVMQEAFEVSYGYNIHTHQRQAKYKNVTYFTHRNLSDFAQQIAQHSSVNTVVVADLAMSNGGETALIRALDKNRALDKIKGYAGWNTTCNSLGTALAVLAFAHLGDTPGAVTRFLKQRLVSDWAYQTEVRFPVQFDYLPELDINGIHSGNFAQFESQIFTKVKEEIGNVWSEHVCYAFDSQAPDITNITAPFKRMSGLNIMVN